MRVLVVNAFRRNVLASVRSLGRSGLDITIDIAYQKPVKWRHRFLKSRYVDRVFSTADPVRDLQQFEDDIRKLLENGYDFVLPFGLKTTVPLSKLKSEVESTGAVLPVPGLETVLKAHDKETCLKLAESIGLEVPKTYWYADPAELFDADLPYPVVAKPRRFSGVGGNEFAVVRNRDELVQYFEHVADDPTANFIIDRSRPIVQEFVHGQVHDANFFIHEGRILQFVFQRRVECVLGEIGAGIHNRTLKDSHADAAFEFGSKLLTAIGWNGSCMVELMLESQTDRFKLLEVNPKLWGTLELSIKAGVDFPLEMIRYYCLHEPSDRVDYKEMDFYWLWDLLRWRRARGKPLGLRELLRLYRKEHTEIDLRDVGPELRRFFRHLSGRATL